MNQNVPNPTLNLPWLLNFAGKKNLTGHRQRCILTSQVRLSVTVPARSIIVGYWGLLNPPPLNGR